jgi:predicted transcriptional regulator
MAARDGVMTNKELVIQAMADMPDEATFADIVERIETLAAIREGQADIDADRVVSNEEMKRRTATWLSK